MEIIYLPPGELTPYAANAKRHPQEQVQHIANSIREFGFRQPIVVDADNVVVIGHGRLLAAKELGLETVPVVKADDLTEAQIKALRLADNKTNESEWDLLALGAELAELALDFDMSRFGFEGMDTDEVDDAEIVEDEPPEPPEQPTAKLGDVYQLGDHRLMCGDSTDPDVVDKLIDEAEIDLLMTDPPYNCDVGSCERPHSSNDGVHILNDNMGESDFISFLTSALWNAGRHMRAGAAYYIWYAGLHHIEFESAVRAIEDFKLHEQLIWVKSHFVLGRNSDYQWMHECCLYGWKEGAAHYFTDSRAESTVIEDKAVKLSTMKKGDLIALCEKLLGQNQAGTVLRADKPNAADLHPTMKPVALVANAIMDGTEPGMIVMDAFGGSGTTLIACEQMNRKCRMMELDPRYVDVIIRRWENLTGEKAVRLN